MKVFLRLLTCLAGVALINEGYLDRFAGRRLGGVGVVRRGPPDARGFDRKVRRGKHIVDAQVAGAGATRLA